MGDHDVTAPLDGDVPIPSALVAGVRVGDYEVGRALGRGSYGAVYEAIKHPLGKRVALKVLHREHATRRDLVQRFTREAAVVAGLEHPHIAHVFDVGAHDDVPFLVMEFLDGETLADRLAREGRLPVPEAVDLLLGVVSAVAAAHAKGVIHRDLKPDNVFLARMPAGPPVAKVLDFGVAKVLDAEVALTRTRSLVGTPLYMSPEQAEESRDINAATDQWSLAVILYECVTGARPFAAASLLSLLNAIARDAHASARARESTVPQGLSAALDRALHKRPGARFPSVSALGAALLPYASVSARAHGDSFGVASEAAMASTLDGVTRPPRAALNPRRVALTALALAALGLLAMGMTRPSSAPPDTAAPRATTSVRDAADVTVAADVPHAAADVPRPPPDVAEPPPQRAQVPSPRRRPPASPPPAAPAVTPRAPRPEDCPNGICPVD